MWGICSDLRVWSFLTVPCCLPQVFINESIHSCMQSAWMTWWEDRSSILRWRDDGVERKFPSRVICIIPFFFFFWERVYHSTCRRAKALYSNQANQSRNHLFIQCDHVPSTVLEALRPLGSSFASSLQLVHEMGLLRLAEFRRQEGPGVGVTEKEPWNASSSLASAFHCGVQGNPEFIFPQERCGCRNDPDDYCKGVILKTNKDQEAPTWT